MMARFRKKRRKNYRGGSVSIQAHEDGQSTDDIMAQKNASDVEAANAQMLRNKIGGGKRRRRNQIGGTDEPGETYVQPSSANASPQGNKSMGDAAELQAQNQANQKYEGGGRRTRRKRSRRRKKTRRRRRRKSKRKRKTRRRRKRR
jgi:hypothetical protein